MRVNPIQSNIAFKSKVEIVDGYNGGKFDDVMYGRELVEFKAAINSLEKNGDKNTVRLYPFYFEGDNCTHVGVKVIEKIKDQKYEGSCMAERKIGTSLQKKEVVAAYHRALNCSERVYKQPLDKWRI